LSSNRSPSSELVTSNTPSALALTPRGGHQNVIDAKLLRALEKDLQKDPKKAQGTFSNLLVPSCQRSHLYLPLIFSLVVKQIKLWRKLSVMLQKQLPNITTLAAKK